MGEYQNIALSNDIRAMVAQIRPFNVLNPYISAAIAEI